MGLVMAGLMISRRSSACPCSPRSSRWGMVDTYRGTILPQCAPAAMVYILY